MIHLPFLSLHRSHSLALTIIIVARIRSEFKGIRSAKVPQTLVAINIYQQ